MVEDFFLVLKLLNLLLAHADGVHFKVYCYYGWRDEQIKQIILIPWIPSCFKSKLIKHVLLTVREIVGESGKFKVITIVCIMIWKFWVKFEMNWPS